MGPLKTNALQQLSQRSSLFWWQHCELNSESEVRWGPMGALCFDARGERAVLSPCPTQRPTTSTLRWKFIKARLSFFFFLSALDVITVDVRPTHCGCFLLQLSGQLLHLQSQLCLEAVQEGGLPEGHVNTHVGGLFLRPCSRHPRQQWHFEQLVAPKGA